MLDWHSSYAKKFLGVLKWKCLYNSFHEPFSLRLDYLCLSISNQVRAMLFPDVTRWKAGTRSSPCVAGCVSSDEVDHGLFDCEFHDVFGEHVAKQTRLGSGETVGNYTEKCL